MRKSARKILLLGLLLTSISSFADEGLDFVTLDKETYRYYQEGKWDSLILLGNEGLSQGFDYFYLRYRMGIAYYTLENYSKAEKHFQKAHEFNQSDETLLSYLYYTNAFLNRENQAAYYARQIKPDKRKELVDFRDSFVEKIYLETGFLGGDDLEKNGDLARDWTDSTIYIENQLSDNTFYTHGGLNFRLGPRLGLYAAVNYIRKEKTNKYRYYTDLELDEIIDTEYTRDYYYKMIHEEKSFSSYVKQLQFYLKTDLLLEKDWTLSPYLHYLNVRYKKFDVLYSPHEESAIAYYDKTQMDSVYFDYIRNQYKFKRKDTSLNDYILGISAVKHLDCFSFSMGASVSRLNFNDQLALHAGLTYFPFGNLKLYGSTNVSYYHEKSINDQTDSKILFFQQAGIQVVPRLWLEGSFGIGGLENTYRENAFVVYNVYDKIRYLLEANLILALSGQLEISIRYQFREKESSYVHYYNDYMEKTVYNIIDTRYNEQMIIGGLIWMF